MITVKCILPAGFTMTEYKRISDTRHAPSLGMTDEEYILFQTEELKKDLLARLKGLGIDKSKLLDV